MRPRATISTHSFWPVKLLGDSDNRCPRKQGAFKAATKLQNSLLAHSFALESHHFVSIFRSLQEDIRRQWGIDCNRDPRIPASLVEIRFSIPIVTYIASTPGYPN